MQQQLEEEVENYQHREQQLPRHLQIRRQLLQGIQRLVEQVENYRQGLTIERIERFEHFSADKSLVGKECIVCLEDLQVDMEMVRLDCHVSHYLCKTCTDTWFKDHNKFIACNHVFN